ncbi:MAG: hypothetical protein AAF333_08035 [Planctomycetota bacterium]
MRWLSFGLLCVVCVGCVQENHFSEAMLYKQKNGNVFAPQGIGSNPVFVDSNSVFKIEIERIKPGWIHNGDSMPSLDDSQYVSFSNEITSHILGKELWLITRIDSLSANDVLERNSKVYFKATNVKFNSESFSEMAIDESEKAIFTHSADNQYRITFRLYEVDGFDIKKAAVKAYDSSPGLVGLAETAADVFLDTLGSLAGTVVSDLWDAAGEEDLFLERLLLANDATLEFQGTIYVLRSSGGLSDEMPFRDTSYILYDKFKSEGPPDPDDKTAGWNTGFRDKGSYIKVKKQRDEEVDISPPSNGDIDTKSYIKIVVSEGYSRQEIALRGIDLDGLAASFTEKESYMKFLRNLKID